MFFLYQTEENIPSLKDKNCQERLKYMKNIEWVASHLFSSNIDRTKKLLPWINVYASICNKIGNKEKKSA